MKKYILIFMDRGYNEEVGIDASSIQEYWVEAVDQEEAERKALLCIGFEIYASQWLDKLVEVKSCEERDIGDLSNFEECITYFNPQSIDWIRDDKNRIVKVEFSKFAPGMDKPKVYFQREIPSVLYTVH